MVVSINGGTQKVIIQFHGTFHHKPSIGYPHLWKPPYSIIIHYYPIIIPYYPILSHIIICMITTFSKHSNPTPSFRILITSQALKEAPWPERAISELWWDPFFQKKKTGSQLELRFEFRKRTQAFSWRPPSKNGDPSKSSKLWDAMRSFWSFRWFTVAFSKHITSWGVNVDLASEELEAKSKALSSGSVMGVMGVMGWR